MKWLRSLAMVVFLLPAPLYAQEGVPAQPKPQSPMSIAIAKVTGCMEGAMGKDAFNRAQAQLMADVMFKGPAVKALCVAQKYDKAKTVIVETAKKPYAVALLAAQKHCTKEIEALRHDPSMQKTREQIGTLADFNGDFEKLDMKQHCGLITPKGTNHGI